MSRINYSEDEDFPGQFALWRSNTWRAIRGRAGQQSLRELLAALEAMPERRLVSHALATEDAGVCAVGALVVTRVAATDGLTWADAAAAVREEYTPTACAECEHPERDHTANGCTGCAELAAWAARDAEERGLTWKPKGCPGFEPMDPRESDVLALEGDPQLTEAAGQEIAGMPEKVAWRLVELNDMDLDHVTPEERWVRVHAWVERALRPGATDPSAPYGY